MICYPEISSDGFKPYMPAIRDAFAGSASHGTIFKTSARRPALGLIDRPWSIGELLDAALKVVPIAPPPLTPPERRRQIEGGKK